MPVIIGHAHYVTQINHIRVAPENIDELVGKMGHQLETAVALAPGFVSSSIHRSDDGGNFVNYVQFETAAQLDAVHQSDAFKSHFEGYRTLIIEGGPHLYTVVRVLERPLAPAGEDRGLS